MPNREENFVRLTALKETMQREKVAEALFPDTGRWDADELSKRRTLWTLFDSTAQKVSSGDSLAPVLAKVMDESVGWVQGVLLEAKRQLPHPIPARQDGPVSQN